MITLISIILILACIMLDLNTFFSIIEYECDAEKTINPYESNFINYSIEYDNGLD